MSHPVFMEYGPIVYSYQGIKPDSVVASICSEMAAASEKCNSAQVDRTRGQSGYLFLTRVCVDYKRKLVFHHVSFDSRQKQFPFLINCRIKVLLDHLQSTLLKSFIILSSLLILSPLSSQRNSKRSLLTFCSASVLVGSGVKM